MYPTPFLKRQPIKCVCMQQLINSFVNGGLVKDEQHYHPNIALSIQRALQRHLESPLLLIHLINNILVNKMVLQPTMHEPYLYSGKYDNNDIILLRQGDDFAIACTYEAVSKKITDNINSHMPVDIKHIDPLTSFNNIGIDQTDEYAKIHNNTYISKIIYGHKNWIEDRHCHTFTLAMKAK